MTLIEHLPAEASVWEKDTKAWTQSDELRAQQIEIVDAWSRILYQTLYSAHSGGKKPKMPPPVEIDHPGRRIEREKPKVERDPEQIKRFFQRF